MDRTLSAPGKLFVAGEYSVLWGGTAWVLAVAPRATAMVRPLGDRRIHVLQEGARCSGWATPGGVNWDEPLPPAFLYVARAVDWSFRLTGADGPGMAIACSASQAVGGHKLGMGGSARAAVLASEATRGCLKASYDALKVALVAHADAQGGQGSGADVAACFAGGFVRYRRFDSARLLGAAQKGQLSSALGTQGSVDVLRLPPPRFPMLYAFSGHSASTPRLVSEVERQVDAKARQDVVAASDELGDGLEQALARGDFSRVVQACRELQVLLGRLASARSMAGEQILALAQTYGCAGKQSGAGGGDGYLLLGPDEAALEALEAALVARGIFTQSVRVETGLQNEKACDARLRAWLEACDGE